MRVTVAVCTWNRCHLLRQALERMTFLSIPAGVEWELLVVNNGSTDSTDAVTAEFRSRLPVQALHEPNIGHSHARNRAVGAAQGDYVLWTDDDALVEDDWMAVYVEAFRRWPEAAFFGGPIRPMFAVRPPPWLERAWPQVADAYAVRELGAEPFRLGGDRRFPYGANYAVRCREQRAHLYDVRLGHRRERRMGGEETRLFLDLVAEGCHGWWVPNAAVRHYVEPDRMTVRYIRSFYVGIGRSLARNKPRSPVRSALKLLRAGLRYFGLRYFFPAEVWMRHLVAASTAWGRLLR